MGEQVRIVDLVHDLIRLSGYEVGRDIDVAYVGLRPGEKLEEELFFPDETRQTTVDERIFVVNSGVDAKLPDFSAVMAGLESAVQDNGDKALVDALRWLVVEFQPAD